MRRYVRGGSAQKLDWLVVEEITQLDMALWADLACVGLNADVKFLLLGDFRQLPAVLDSWAGRPISAPLEHSQLIRDLAGGHRHKVVLRHAVRDAGLLRVHRGVAEHQDDLGGQNSDVLDLKVGAQRGPRRVRAPRRSRTTAQLLRPQTQFLSPGSAAAAASSRSAGCPPWWGAAARPCSRPGAPRGRGRVVHFVETLHGLVAVVLSALQQVMRGHGAAVVVDVVAALGWAWPGPAGWRRPCS